MSDRLRGPRARTAAAAIALVLGVAGLVFAAVFQGERRMAPAGDTPVNAGARDPGDIDAHNSPAIARDPTRPERLAVANRIDTPDYSCALHVSDDGGAKWSRVSIPLPRGGPGGKCYAPDVAFGADGTLHVSFVTLQGNGNTPAAGWVTRSSDGGRTLSTPRRVLDALAFQVRLVADPQRARRLYLTWVQAENVGIFRFSAPGNPVLVARSDDGGRTWGEPVTVSAPSRGRVLAPTAAFGPDGSLYILYLDVGEDRLDYEGGHRGKGGPPYDGRFALVLGRSTDGGATWQESVVDDDIVPARRFVALLPPTPALAVDGSDGRIYAAFEDGAGGHADVHLWSLAPGASEWTGPVRVNDTPDPDSTSQYLPRIAVAPDGRLDVLYYDRRTSSVDRVNTVSLQSSWDGGRTFSPAATLSTSAFDSRVGAGSERGLPDLGSRLALVSGESSALAAWTDTRAGTVASNKQDVAFGRATVTRASAISPTVRAAIRGCAIALLLVGVALLAAPRLRGARAAT